MADSVRSSLGLPADWLIFLFLFSWVALDHVILLDFGILVPPLYLAVTAGIYLLVCCIVDAFKAWSTPLSHPATLKLTFPSFCHASFHWNLHLWNRSEPDGCWCTERFWYQVWAKGAEVAAAYPVIIKKWKWFNPWQFQNQCIHLLRSHYWLEKNSWTQLPNLLPLTTRKLTSMAENEGTHLSNLPLIRKTQDYFA